MNLRDILEVLKVQGNRDVFSDQVHQLDSEVRVGIFEEVAKHECFVDFDGLTLSSRVPDGLVFDLGDQNLELIDDGFDGEPLLDPGVEITEKMLDELALLLPFPCERAVLDKFPGCFLIFNEELREALESQGNVLMKAIELEASAVYQLEYDTPPVRNEVHRFLVFLFVD